MAEEQKARPEFSSMLMDTEAGVGIWMPKEWHKIKLAEGHKGMLYAPNAEDVNTGLLVEKRKLPYKVNVNDLPTLREAFMGGIKALPGVEIESQDESLTHGISFFETRFSFMDGDVRRKRWIRNIYWNRNNTILIAQGRTVEDYEYWLPMFYHMMMNTQL